MEVGIWGLTVNPLQGNRYESLHGETIRATSHTPLVEASQVAQCYSLGDARSVVHAAPSVPHDHLGLQAEALVQQLGSGNEQYCSSNTAGTSSSQTISIQMLL